MAQGIPVDGQLTQPCSVWQTAENEFHIVLTQGLNRQIRKMAKEALSKRLAEIGMGEKDASIYAEIYDRVRHEINLMREILNGVQLIIDGYTGSIFNVPNLYNIFGYLESISCTNSYI